MTAPEPTSKQPNANDIVWHSHAVTRDQREAKHEHRGAVIWLTGLPGSGKSTLAHALEETLHHLGYQTAVLDGDNVRHGLCADLGFSAADRNENVRRVGEVAKILLELGTVVIVALVSPVREARDKVRRSLPEGDFIEIYCRCSLVACKIRDPKGLYAKAEQGLIPEFTGISSPYEAPLTPELEIDTESEKYEEALQRLMLFVLNHFTAEALRQLSK